MVCSDVALDLINVGSRSDRADKCWEPTRIHQFSNFRPKQMQIYRTISSLLSVAVPHSSSTPTAHGARVGSRSHRAG